MKIRERILIALERSNKSQRDLAKAMDLSSPTVNAMLSKDEIDSIKYIKAVEDLTGYCFEWIRTGTGPEKIEVEANHDRHNDLSYWKDKLKTKDELIEELRGRIADMKKYQELLEKEINKKK